MNVINIHAMYVIHSFTITEQGNIKQYNCTSFLILENVLVCTHTQALFVLLTLSLPFTSTTITFGFAVMGHR